MADLLTTDAVAMATGAYGDYFDSVKKPLIFHKEPIKNIVSTSSPSMYGYGQSSNSTNVTYTPVSGIYYGMVIEGGKRNEASLGEIHQRLEQDEVIFKIQADARDFLLDGTTERIEYAGKFYNNVTEGKVSSFLDYTLYRFKGKLTN